jgi:hypothetical protein
MTTTLAPPALLRRAGHGGQLFERAAELAVVEVVQPGHGPRRLAVPGRNTHHQAIGLVDGDGPQQRRVDDAEQRSGRADADGEHQDGHCGESCVFSEGSQCVTTVLQEYVDGRPEAGIAHEFLDLLGASQIDARAAPRIRRVHAAFGVLVGKKVDVALEFLVQIAIELFFAE